jgi:hypothetical protein
MKLLREVAQDLGYLVEDKGTGPKSVFIEGIFAQANKGNKNGRYYPESVMKKEVERYNNLINEKRSLGELGHPANPSINLDKVSHLITELRMDGHNVIGRAKVLDTPMGSIAKNLIENGVKLGVSTRGLGSLKSNKDGLQEVQDDFHLATVDIVADPSAHDAFVQGIYESAEWVMTNGVWTTIDAENAQVKLKAASTQNLEETKLQIFEQFINKLSR